MGRSMSLKQGARKTATTLRLSGKKNVLARGQPVLRETILQEANSEKKMLIASSLTRTLKVPKLVQDKGKRETLSP